MVLRYRTYEEFVTNYQLHEMQRRKEHFYCVYCAEIKSFKNEIFCKIGNTYTPRNRIMILNKHLSEGGNNITKIALIPKFGYGSEDEEHMHEYFYLKRIVPHQYACNAREVCFQLFNCYFIGMTEVFAINLETINQSLEEISRLRHTASELKQMSIPDLRSYVFRNPENGQALKIFSEALNSKTKTKNFTTGLINQFKEELLFIINADKAG